LWLEETRHGNHRQVSAGYPFRGYGGLAEIELSLARLVTRCLGVRVLISAILPNLLSPKVLQTVDFLLQSLWLTLTRFAKILYLMELE